MEETSFLGTMGEVLAQEDLYPERFVGYDGYLCGAGKKSAGVTPIGCREGRAAAIQKTGSPTVEIGGTISAPGVPIASDGDGKAVEAEMPEGGTALTWTDLIAVNGFAEGDPDSFPKTSGKLRVSLSL